MRRLLLLLAFLSVIAPAAAHPPTVLNAGASQGITDELLDFRRRMAVAIRAKDVALLRKMYAEAFQHIHTSAKTDGRDARIVSAVAGDPVIETAEAEAITVHIHAGGWAAVVTGATPIRALSDGKTYKVLWTQVFVRNVDDWQLAASQATRGAEVKAP
jgi:ketosteroid isomerase-like protein